MYYRLSIYFFLAISLALTIPVGQNVQAEFYKYIDKEGVLRFVDDPSKIPPEHRKSIKAYQERYDHLSNGEKQDKIEEEQLEGTNDENERVSERPFSEQPSLPKVNDSDLTDYSQQDENLETPVVIRGNHVLVPATLGYEDNEVQALLLLDTGATIIALHESIADQLNITSYRVAKAQVAGGKTVRFKLARLSYIQIGPKRIENIQAGIIKYKGPKVDHNGLLGMNFLRRYQYRVDYKRRVIKWGP
jgi:predicted aspartyl protease